ncbi:uncharacterized protein LOC143191166 [Rhynchophorus ferrugineus]|uniref:Smr domain-containing protein n=1 Tax=Rhynchophorus ferrugineus TaxID=354439 RepID=A0A834HY44_RHYFE|nr:hypothetical protein GWI33_018027 [Rhynchophorus ferrugineus]
MYNQDFPVENMMEVVELDLSKLLVDQLEEKFGDPTFVYPEGFKRKIQVPISFAKQLYSFYIESVFDQMEATFGNETVNSLKAEDEEFSELLYEAEVDSAAMEELQKPSTSGNVITKRKIRKNKKKKQVTVYKNITPEELAFQMELEKLSQNFPLIEKETIMQLLQADNYEETVNALLTIHLPTNDNITDIKKPPLNEDLLKEIQDDFLMYKNQLKSKQVYGEDYRKDAETYFKNRKKLYEKANNFKQKRLMGVAEFYLDLAIKQTLYYEQASSRAVLAFINSNSKQSRNNTLNLHFLRLVEAKTAVDIFLDENINSLRESGSKTKSQLQIITGRGKHSPDGKAVLRPAIQSLLKERGLKFNLLNEGLIAVKITKASKLTVELKK